MLILFIISLVLIAIFVILGCIFIAPSGALICYLVSLFFIFVGLTWVFVASVYQRKWHVKKLYNKYCKIKGESGKSVEPNIVFDFIFKYRVFPTQNHWFILLSVIGIVVSLLPYQNWNGAECVLDMISIFRMTMQMFVVDGSVSDFTQVNFENLPVWLKSVSSDGILLYDIYTALLCVLTGLIFTFKLINFFAKEFKAYIDYWFVHPRSDIYVMSELNEKSITLAESIFLKYYGRSSSGDQCKDEESVKKLAKFVRIYFCDVYSDNKERGAELISRAKRLGAVVMKRDIAEIKIKRYCKSNKFYLIGDLEEENVEQAQQICASNEAIKLKKNLDVYIYATRQESEFIIDNMHNEEGNENEKEKGNQK